MVAPGHIILPRSGCHLEGSQSLLALDITRGRAHPFRGFPICRPTVGRISPTPGRTVLASTLCMLSRYHRDIVLLVTQCFARLGGPSVRTTFPLGRHTQRNGLSGIDTLCWPPLERTPNRSSPKNFKMSIFGVLTFGKIKSIPTGRHF